MKMLPILVAIALVATLAGCTASADTWKDGGATTANSPSPTTSPASTSDPADDRWESAPAQDPNVSDYFQAGNVRVAGNLEDLSNGAQSREASKAGEPAPVLADGSIFVSFSLRYSPDVRRDATRAFISGDAKGKDVGPELSCSPGDIPQEIICFGSFRDRDYASGTYYGVFTSKPVEKAEKSRGAKRLIVPFYTALAQQ